MKTMILLCLLSVPAVAFAEHEGNPDKAVSVGYTYSGTSTDGGNSARISGLTASQFSKTRSYSAVWDLRIPISDVMTIYGAYGSVRSESGASEAGVLPGVKNDQSGHTFSVGARLYLQ